ncbi:hypothetical protein ES703_101700 [subsurface metagenome]
MEELDKKIAEWVGLKDFGIYADHAGDYYYMQFPEPDQNVAYYRGQAFHLSLDACFKYIVPKLGYKEILLVPRPTTEESWSCWIGKFGIGQGTMPEAVAEGFETPALAFCKAVEKLIDKE